ncbi:MAG: DUF6134 family protein [Bacteroidia bacterium]
MQSVFFLFALLFPVSGFTQEQTYSIIKGSTRIGIVSASCQKKGNRSIYSIWSEAKTRFIIDIRVNMIVEEIFEAGHMEHSTLIRKINGKEKVHNTADKTAQGYVLKKKGNTYKTFSTLVNYSIAAMYFIEPFNRHFVYSEYYQQIVPVSAVGAHHYLIEFPNGNKSYYTYSNGICTATEVHTEWAVLFFKLDENHSINSAYNKN